MPDNKTESTARVQLIYVTDLYKELVEEVCKKAGARQVCIFVLDGNEGPGVARHNADDSNGKDFIQDAVDAKFFAEGLKQISELYDREATMLLAAAIQAGHKPNPEQVKRALGMAAVEAQRDGQTKKESS